MYVECLNVCKCTTYVQCLWRPEEELGSHEARVIEGVSLHVGLRPELRSSVRAPSAPND